MKNKYMRLFLRSAPSCVRTSIAFDHYINKGLDTKDYSLYEIHIIILLRLYNKKYETI